MSTLHIITQYLAPKRALTWLAGKLSEVRQPWFKNWQIRHLVKTYGVDLEAALSSNPEDYPTFNSFFTRHLKPELRPIAKEANVIVSPADGSVSQAGHIQKDLLFQAKGFQYSLQSLLGGSEKLAKLFEDGEFATIYLAPKDYHRVHMPFDGQLSETLFVPGKLFSVNTLTARSIPNLFTRNERLISIFETQLGPMAVILVGAMLVGSIETVWDANTKSETLLHETHDGQLHLAKGEELGHFKMGSTVILLFAKNQMQWTDPIVESLSLQMGQAIGLATEKILA